MRQGTVLRYELYSAVRSKWIYAYAIAIAMLAVGFDWFSDEARKTELALVTTLSVVVPLVSMLFTTTYWYSSEQFTEMLLAQPVSRRRVYWSRFGALAGSLSLCLVLGLALPGALMGFADIGLFWTCLTATILSTIFCSFGSLVSIAVRDRMWGIGLGLAIWFYFIALHDAFLLFVLYQLRDYPLETFSAVLCAMNPVGLMRVTLLMFFDAPLLFGHSGALIRNFVETGIGYLYALLCAGVYLILPTVIGQRLFCKRDF